jgi:outer membrane protein OmpA-like peptidoglycan-associated protein
MTPRTPFAMVAAVAALFLLLSAGHPARAQANSVMVFFDAGSTEVGPSAKQLVDIIRSALKRSSRVTITGHTDTAEPNAHALSLARATALLTALVAAEVPQGVTFTVSGKGATAPMVRTGPNVGEPRNRVVTVQIR